LRATPGYSPPGRRWSRALRKPPRLLLHAHRAIEVSDLTEFTEVLAACQGATRATGRRIGIVTSSGGLVEMILDIADAAALELPPLSAAARDDIVARIGFITGDGNPLDAWGGGSPTRSRCRSGVRSLASHPDKPPAPQ
jgi:acyl-CoA synthetase (NDP forming)